MALSPYSFETKQINLMVYFRGLADAILKKHTEFYHKQEQIKQLELKVALLEAELKEIKANRTDVDPREEKLAAVQQELNKAKAFAEQLQKAFTDLTERFENLKERLNALYEKNPILYAYAEATTNLQRDLQQIGRAIRPVLGRNLPHMLRNVIPADENIRMNEVVHNIQHRWDAGEPDFATVVLENIFDDLAANPIREAAEEDNDFAARPVLGKAAEEAVAPAPVREEAVGIAPVQVREPRNVAPDPIPGGGAPVQEKVEKKLDFSTAREVLGGAAYEEDLTADSLETKTKVPAPTTAREATTAKDYLPRLLQRSMAQKILSDVEEELKERGVHLSKTQRKEMERYTATKILVSDMSSSKSKKYPLLMETLQTCVDALLSFSTAGFQPKDAKVADFMRVYRSTQKESESLTKQFQKLMIMTGEYASILEKMEQAEQSQAAFDARYRAYATPTPRPKGW